MLESQHETIYWLGLRLDVPRDWQIVRHGISTERGRLTFTDRFAERLDLTWRHLDYDPDVEHLVRDQRTRDERELTRCQTTALRINGWHAYQRRDTNETLVRAARYDAKSKRVIEALLITEPKQGRTTKVTEQLLNAVRCAATSSECHRLRAFDIDVQVPDGLHLSLASVEPANVIFEFEATAASAPADKRGATAIVRRMGMAQSWYRGNAARLLERESPRVRFEPTRELAINAHVGVYAEGDASSGRIPRWLGRGRRRRAVVWHCEAENAVYHVATTSLDRTPLLPDSFRCACCKGDRG